MDIVIQIDDAEFKYFLSYKKGDSKEDMNFHVCRKQAKKLNIGNRIYFKHKNHIVGHGIAAGNYERIREPSTIIDDFILQSFVEQINPECLGYAIMQWDKMYWYGSTIRYARKMSRKGFRYIDIKKIQNGEAKSRGLGTY